MAQTVWVALDHLKDQFLEKFNPISEDDWTIICEGRIGRLRLEGPQGCLDIFVLYLTTGNNAEAKDERAKQARLLARHIAPQSDRLSLVLGDFNFVTEKEDRVSKASGQCSGTYDLQEKELFEDILWKPKGFNELRQPHFTHESGLARSRLDRVYSNHFLVEQLDRFYACYTLPIPANLSAHTAIAFEKTLPREAGPKQT